MQGSDLGIAAIDVHGNNALQLIDRVCRGGWNSTQVRSDGPPEATN